jgi:transcriptional regulator with XRE-family HTH domain
VPIGTYLVNWLFCKFSEVAKPIAEITCSIVVRLLREKREALGLSMNIVAQRAQMSHTMISRVERELRRPTLDTLFRISEAMDVELWPLIKKAEKLSKNNAKHKIS